MAIIKNTIVKTKALMNDKIKLLADQNSVLSVVK